MTSTKRKQSVGFNFIPKALQDRQAEVYRFAHVLMDFDSSLLGQVLIRNVSFTSDQAHLAIVELFRFLSLKVLENDLDATKLSPSGIVDHVWHHFMLLPKLYSEFCNRMLPSQGVGPVRLIDHNPLGADDDGRADR
jgi:hypothetical protein